MTVTHRQRCFEEYDRLCQSCDATGTLDVHHIDGDQTNNSLENLIPLCKSCHRKVHNHTPDTRTIEKLIPRMDDPQPAFDPENFKDVPSNGATVTVKEVAPGQRYYYWQWRDGDQIKSRYIGPVENDMAAPRSVQQSTLRRFV